MTRINVVPVSELSVRHLCAEYRELPRVFRLAHKASLSAKPWTDRQPREYTLGTGHVLFFYDKLGWLADRHQELTQEMHRRGYTPFYNGTLREAWPDIPECYWKCWTVTGEALVVNRERIALRLAGSSERSM